MAGWDAPRWDEMFVPDLSLFESFLRGSFVYLLLVVLFRVVLRRQAGSIGVPDVLLVVLVSECVSDSLAAEAKSISNGLTAVGSLLLWNFALDWLAFRWPWLRRRLEPKPLQLVQDGRPIREHLRRERISDEELIAQLRENGIDDVAKVKAAYLESEGTVSVISADEKGDPTLPQPSPVTNPLDFEEAVRQFVTAAEAVQAAVAWHEDRAAEHQSAAKAARNLLSRHGVRSPRAVRSSRREDAGRTEVATPPAEPAEAGPRLRDGPEAAVRSTAV
jgi:uncharacterized membrane protein YcaP (DUF421 family)